MVLKQTLFDTPLWGNRRVTTWSDIFTTPYVQSRPLEGIFHHPHIVGLPSQVAKVPDPWLRSRSPESQGVDKISIWCWLKPLLTVIQLQSAGEPKKEARNLPYLCPYSTCLSVSESNVLSCLCVGHISKGTGTKFLIALVTCLCTCIMLQKNLGTANPSVQVSVKKKQLSVIQTLQELGMLPPVTL